MCWMPSPRYSLQVFLDLRLVVLRLVDRDADLAARAGHGAAEQAGLLALDVEVADLAEVEQLLVEAGPLVHVAARDVVRQVIDVRESGPGIAVHAAGALHGQEVDVIDRALAVPVDQVDETAADAFDGRDLQLHRTDTVLHRLRAEVDAALESGSGILHAEGHRACRRAVLAREVLAEAVRLGVDDEVDVALPVQRDVLAAMPRSHREAQPLEQRAQQLRVGRGVLDELETVGADGIFQGRTGSGGVHWRVPQVNGYN